MTLRDATSLTVDTVVRTQEQLALVKSVDRLSDPLIMVQFRSGVRRLVRPREATVVRPVAGQLAAFVQ
jgi:hypothetical protein